MESVSVAMGADMVGDMSENTEKPSDFQLILECMERQAEVLQQNRDALILMNGRMDSHGADLKSIRDSMKSIASRQSELELANDKCRVNCAETMQALADRIAVLEDDKTPIPKKLTPDEVKSLYVADRVSQGNGSNGCGDTRLSLSAASADDELSIVDDEDTKP